MKLGFSLDSRDYKYQARKDDDTNIRASMGYRFGPALDVSLSYQFAQRDSDVVDGDYDENRVFLVLTYVPAWGRQ